MLLKEKSFTSTVIATTALTILTSIAPEIVQAATYKGTLNIFSSSNDFYKSEFFLRTNVTTSNPNTTPVTFNLAITDYKVTSSSGASYKRKRADLKAVRYRDTRDSLPTDLAISFPNFNSFEGPFYEYDFSVGNYNTISSILGTPPYPFTNENGQATLKFYIPTDFIYTGDFGRFTIPSSGSLAQSDQNYKKSLTGFQNILKQARNNNVLKFRVPTNVVNSSPSSPGPQPGELPPRAILEFDTTPIPESNSSAGLIGLGIIGGYLIVKQKTTKDEIV